MEISRLFIFMFIIVYANAVILKNGGYEEVYVLIRESNTESDQLIQRIKDVLTKASHFLFTASHRQVYFREIKIIVPKTWSQRHSYKQLPTPPLTDSFFSVDSGSKLKTPQAIGHAMCGKAGHFIHLPAAFLMRENRTKWGLHDRVIVHEWGHLRWGLFNELPPKQNKFYQANGTWNPARCTDEIKGKILLNGQQSSECNIKDTSKLMHEKCTFIPSSQQHVDASLMSYPYIDKISEFCDRNNITVKREHRHNSFAPTKQNIGCNYKSAWEIMQLHSDFQNTKQLPESTNTTPTFEISQETANYRVFVLDMSGSMKTYGRLTTLQNAIKNVIQQLAVKGSWIGIVSFSTKAKVEKDLTEVNTQQDREALIKAIPKKATGWTCIGCGLTEATKILKKKLGNVANGEIVLVSDGKDTKEAVNVDVNVARQEVIDAKITVHTIAVSQQADHLLGDIARETGGMYFTYFDNGGISLLGAFSQTFSSSQTSARKKNVMLMSNKIDTVKSYQHNISFALEEGLGDDTTFTFVTPRDTGVQLQLTGPNGYNQSIQSYDSITTLSIPDTAQVGEYEMTITTNTIPKTIEYYAKSDATSDDIIRVTSQLSSNNIDLSTGDLPIIYSEVSKGYLPVLNATVTARVETGDNACDVSLTDDGIDPDLFSEDGIYSGFICPHCLHSGRVNVKVDVKGNKGDVKILQSVTGAPSEEEVEDRTEVYNNSFQRVELVEQLYITNYINSTTSDWIAPGKITDVSIRHIQTKVSSKEERRYFTITWTATGDDKSVGRAKRYIFKIADKFEDLLQNFDNATTFEVKNGSLIPKQSGETEVLKIVVDAKESFTGTAFFAVQAVDETGNRGSVSNIISIVVAKGYRAFVEEGTLDNENSIVTSCADCFQSVFLFVVTSFIYIFYLM